MDIRKIGDVQNLGSKVGQNTGHELTSRLPPVGYESDSDPFSLALMVRLCHETASCR
jgi:hypothetical protein